MLVIHGEGFHLMAPLWSLPQVASGRQCPQPWSTSLGSTCTAWPFPTCPAVANLTSSSRSTASTATPLPRPFGRCSAAPPMQSNTVSEPRLRACRPAVCGFKTCLDWFNPAQFFQSPPLLWMPPSPQCTKVLWFLCCSLWVVSRRPSHCASVTCHTRTKAHIGMHSYIWTHSSVLKVNDFVTGGLHCTNSDTFTSSWRIRVCFSFFFVFLMLFERIPLEMFSYWLMWRNIKVGGVRLKRKCLSGRQEKDRKKVVAVVVVCRW